MRSWLCVLLLASPLCAQQITREPAGGDGMFFVDGIVYHYVERSACTVVVAAHSVINHKFLAVKVRVYNPGPRSITVQPEDVAVEDAMAGRALAAISGTELARKMRKPQNMARYAVNGVNDAPGVGPITSDMVSPAFLEMMKAISARAGKAAPGRSVLYTDAPGAMDVGEMALGPIECDEVCRLRNREAQDADALTQLQHPSSPDSVEQFALLANTIPPHASISGVLYFPLGKLAEARLDGEHGRKTGKVRITVPVAGEKFQFEAMVE